MKLETLFAGVEYTGTLPQGDVTLVTQDSRRAGPGAVFVCAKGHTTDGHTFAQKALEAGAACIVTERPLGLQGVFTNLTQDHLDYHGTFENYFAAKKSLFEQVHTMVVNQDDPYGLRLIAEVHPPQVITYSAGDDTADYTARNIQLSAAGVKFEMVGRSFIQRVRVPMPGEYSVSNALAAAATASARPKRGAVPWRFHHFVRFCPYRGRD